MPRRAMIGGVRGCGSNTRRSRDDLWLMGRVWTPSAQISGRRHWFGLRMVAASIRDGHWASASAHDQMPAEGGWHGTTNQLKEDGMLIRTRAVYQRLCDANQQRCQGTRGCWVHYGECAKDFEVGATYTHARIISRFDSMCRKPDWRSTRGGQNAQRPRGEKVANDPFRRAEEGGRATED
jgi:hypothetical protein